MKEPEVKRDSRHRIWASLLKRMVRRQEEHKGEGVTAADLAGEIGMDYVSILQVMRRLRAWGYTRVVGFNPPEGGRGRQRLVFEVTESGKRKVEWEGRSRKGRR